MIPAVRPCLLLLPLLLGGCLLPQPDTPIIPPFAADQTMKAPGRAAPADATAADPGVGAMEQPAAAELAAPDARAAGTLTGSLEGLEAVRVVATPEAEGPKVDAPVREGAFALALAPGSYHLDLEAADGKTLRLGVAITLAPGASRHLRITVQDGTATVSEEVPVEPVATDEATAAATP